MKRALLVAALVAAPASAGATYSISAVDQSTGEVGGAGTSCVGRLDVAVIYGSVPGVGVVHAQARLNEAGRNRAVSLMQMGQTPAQIIAAVADRGFDRSFEQRQYGVVTLAGERAAFTGRDNGTWAGDDGGELGDFVFTVQGNLLTGPNVLSQSKAGFEAEGCDLAARLMSALERGRDNGEGDARCTPRGVPADSAFIRVDPETGGPSLMLSVVDTGNQDPVTLLRARYDEWRTANPCPPPPDAGVIEDARPADADPADLGLEDAPETPDTGLVDAGATDAGVEDATEPDAIGDPAPRRGTISSGCRSGAGSTTIWLALLAPLTWRRRGPTGDDRSSHR